MVCRLKRSLTIARGTSVVNVFVQPLPIVCIRLASCSALVNTAGPCIKLLTNWQAS